jgi:hypothetical protein
MKRYVVIVQHFDCSELIRTEFEWFEQVEIARQAAKAARKIYSYPKDPSDSWARGTLVDNKQEKATEFDLFTGKEVEAK